MDAGTVRADAGNPVVDASAPRADAAIADAGTTPPADASVPSNPNNGLTCRVDSDCKQSCLPDGLASCCRIDNVCGCTWTPGIYCL